MSFSNSYQILPWFQKYFDSLLKFWYKIVSAELCLALSEEFASLEVLSVQECSVFYPASVGETNCSQDSLPFDVMLVCCGFLQSL